MSGSLKLTFIASMLPVTAALRCREGCTSIRSLDRLAGDHRRNLLLRLFDLELTPADGCAISRGVSTASVRPTAVASFDACRNFDKFPFSRSGLQAACMDERFVGPQLAGRAAKSNIPEAPAAVSLVGMLRALCDGELAYKGDAVEKLEDLIKSMGAIAVAPLIAALNEFGKNSGYCVVHTLASLNNLGADAILRLLNSPTTETRALAADGIFEVASFGSIKSSYPDPTPVAILVTLLADADPDVRKNVARALTALFAKYQDRDFRRRALAKSVVTLAVPIVMCASEAARGIAGSEMLYMLDDVGQVNLLPRVFRERGIGYDANLIGHVDELENVLVKFGLPSVAPLIEVLSADDVSTRLNAADALLKILLSKRSRDSSNRPSLSDHIAD